MPEAQLLGLIGEGPCLTSPYKETKKHLCICAYTMLQQHTSLYCGHSLTRISNKTLTHGQTWAGCQGDPTAAVLCSGPTLSIAFAREMLILRVDQNKQGAVHKATPQPEGWMLSGSIWRMLNWRKRTGRFSYLCADPLSSPTAGWAPGLGAGKSSPARLTRSEAGRKSQSSMLQSCCSPSPNPAHAERGSAPVATGSLLSRQEERAAF